MKRKAIAIGSMLIIVFTLVALMGCTKENKVIASVWKEVSIQEEKFAGLSEPVEFDLKKIIIDADYVFSGTVVSRKEYEIEWQDDQGEQWGPFQKSVIEVKVHNEYYGKSPVKGDVIKIYYPYSMSTVFEDSFAIKDDGEYVFFTQALDKEFIDFRSKNSPQDKFEQEKYADVYISDPCYSLMPINGETVFMYRDYFVWDKEVMKQSKPWDSVNTDKISSVEFLENGWFIAFDIKDFEKSLNNFFDNPEELPSANDLQKLRESDTATRESDASKNLENIEQIKPQHE